MKMNILPFRTLPDDDDDVEALLALKQHPHRVAWCKVKRESESVLQDTSMPKHVQQAQNIFEAAQNGSGLNVYHIAAFFPRVDTYVRALLCITLQVGVVPSIIVKTINEITSEEGRGLCPADGHWYHKLTGATLLFYSLYQLYSFAFTFEHGWSVACIRNGPPSPFRCRAPE